MKACETKLADQDSAMEAAIKKEFPGITHKICRWHVINKLSANLNELYSMYEKQDFKEKINSVLNHPLTPGEFEEAWKELIIEFNLQKIVHFRAFMINAAGISPRISKVNIVEEWLLHSAAKALILL